MDDIAANKSQERKELSWRDKGTSLWKKGWKAALVFVALALILILVLLYFLAWRWNTPEGSLKRVFSSIGRGDLEGALLWVDPQGELGTYWYGNRGNIQNAVENLLRKYQVEFSSLKFKSRTQGRYSEVTLVDGTVKVSERGSSDQFALPVSLQSINLVFYMEKKEGKWLIEGLNYDLEKLPRELQF